MEQPKNRAEEYVTWLCRKSFLALWSYPNPRGKDGKELCDVLVVYHPDIIVLSVKEIGIKASGDPSLDWTRWQKRAIEASAKQIYGAERWLKSATEVIRKDGSQGLPLPNPHNRRIHRVAVALGGDGAVPLYAGDLGKGFTHVFEEHSLDAIFGELDTISDFIAYLQGKEALCTAGTRLLLEGGEEDLLAMYLNHGRRFLTDKDLIVLTPDIWKTFTSRPEYKKKKEADRDSYIWDRLTDRFSEDILRGNMEFGATLSENEQCLRMMVRENRFARRILGKVFYDFLERAGQKKVRSRMCKSPSGVIYVFLALPHGEDRRLRVAELSGRCFVARGLNPECTTVVGLATEHYEPGKGFSLDAVYLEKTSWTDEDDKHLGRIQDELGYFRAPTKTYCHEDEYPQE